MFDLEKELKNLPDSPGVYLMHNSEDTIIYVGKAKVLKNRVRQYFHESANHTPKVRAMVSNIAWFEYIMTDSEREALVLECNLIKKHRPKYNVLLKDDKHYPYIKVTLNEPYPRIMMTRRLENDGAKYFGPYMGSYTVNNTLDIVRRIFVPPTCGRKFPQDIGKGRPCLNYHIKNCFAPCMGNITQEEYHKIYEDICDFLEGSHTELLKTLENEMNEAAQNMLFEKAASLRDKIRAVKAIDEKQKIINTDKQTDTDILACAYDENRAFCEVFFVRSGKITGRENYIMENTSELSEIRIMTDFIQQFYQGDTQVPRELLLYSDIEDKELLESWLTEKAGKRVKLVTPRIGEKRRLCEMVKKNAEKAAENDKIRRIKESENNHTPEALKKLLGLLNTPDRIESYDISHISGSDSVASMVVFEHGRPAPSKYRKFKIKYTEGNDDYHSMQEVIYRRFLRAHEETEKIEAGELSPRDAKFLPLPDLILLDGGRGQLSSVKEIMEELDSDVPVYGMVKDNKHRTRGLIGENGEVDIAMTSGVFRFITRVQDEVHRVAVSYHRQLRAKNMQKSELDDIAGVGEKRRKALLKAFGSVARLREASLEEIEAVPGIDKRTAGNVYSHFKN